MDLIDGGKGKVGKVLKLYDPLFNDENIDFKIGYAVGIAKQCLIDALHEVDYEPGDMGSIARYAPWVTRSRFQKMADHFGVALIGPKEDPPPGKEGDERLFTFIPKRAALSVVE